LWIFVTLYATKLSMGKTFVDLVIMQLATKVSPTIYLLVKAMHEYFPVNCNIPVKVFSLEIYFSITEGHVIVLIKWAVVQVEPNLTFISLFQNEGQSLSLYNSYSVTYRTGVRATRCSAYSQYEHNDTLWGVQYVVGLALLIQWLMYSPGGTY